LYRRNNVLIQISMLICFWT